MRINKAKYYYKNRTAVNQRLRDSRKKWKQEALVHYGETCRCCGESEETFLSIDHINNDGAKHRKTDPVAKDLYQWLHRHKFPEGFQTLCRNCNWGKYINGVCPHRVKDANAVA